MSSPLLASGVVLIDRRILGKLVYINQLAMHDRADKLAR
jgi:hypothetical protein